MGGGEVRKAVYDSSSAEYDTDLFSMWAYVIREEQDHFGYERVGLPGMRNIPCERSQRKQEHLKQGYQFTEQNRYIQVIMSGCAARSPQLTTVTVP